MNPFLSVLKPVLLKIEKNNQEISRSNGVLALVIRDNQYSLIYRKLDFSDFTKTYVSLFNLIKYEESETDYIFECSKINYCGLTESTNEKQEKEIVFRLTHLEKAGAFNFFINTNKIQEFSRFIFKLFIHGIASPSTLGDKYLNDKNHLKLVFYENCSINSFPSLPSIFQLGINE